jgi:hypothetical protein
LDNAVQEAPTELTKLLALTKHMDLSVQSLRNSLARQRVAVEALVEESKASGRACERGTHEVRRMSTSSFTVDKPVPSDFFWSLLQKLEANLAEYDVRCAELKQAAASLVKTHGDKKASAKEVVEIAAQQHRAFKLVAQNIGQVHAAAEALRADFLEHVRRTKGEGFAFDDDVKKEKERNRRMLRKVEEQAKVRVCVCV